MQHARRIRSSIWLIATLLLLTSLQLSSKSEAWENADWATVFEPFGDIMTYAMAPDGLNGMLLAIRNPDVGVGTTNISRIDKTGNEIWGNGGLFLPIDFTFPYQSEPVGIAPDGIGGAYVCYAELRYSTWVLVLTRRDASGAAVWVTDVVNLGASPLPEQVQLLAQSGSVVVGFAQPAPKQLMAAMFSDTGSFEWFLPVNDFYEHSIHVLPTGGVTHFRMADDNAGGTLFAWYRYDPTLVIPGNLTGQFGAQRMATDGTALWGSDGVLVWEESTFPHSNFFDARIVGDGSGGAFVATSGGARTYAQYLNFFGTQMWAAGGIVAHATSGSTPNVGTEPEICADGFGGFILAHAWGPLYVQRIDSLGGYPWGTGGVLLPTSGVPSGPSIAADGYGGALIAHEYAESGSTYVGGGRVDHFGTTLWSNPMLRQDTGAGFIHDVRVIADGSGGAHIAWQERDSNTVTDDVYAMGVGPDGDVPAPRLYGIFADAGEPGDVLPVTILGDYLDANQDFWIVEPSLPNIPITSVGVWDASVATGTLDLAIAIYGGYDLEVYAAGLPTGHLWDAFGVGRPPECNNELVGSVNHVAPGSQRVIAFLEPGISRWAEISYDSQTGMYTLWLNENGTFVVKVMDTFKPLRDVTGAVGPDGSYQFAYVQEEGWGHTIVHMHVPLGSGTASHVNSYTDVFAKNDPVIAVDELGTAHIVFEQADALGVVTLQHIRSSAVLFGGPDPVGGGTATAYADMIANGNEVELTYVRDSWFQGVREVCTTTYASGTWLTPTVLHAGVYAWSPSVGVNINGDLLYAWILDNTGSDAFIHTQLKESGVLGPLRARGADGPPEFVSVCGSDTPLFHILTLDRGFLGLDPSIEHRLSDGRVLFPHRRLNSDTDVRTPLFAVDSDGVNMTAHWTANNHPGYSIPVRMGSICINEPVTGVDTTPSQRSTQTLTASPNPFNPRTVFAFENERNVWAKLVIYDSRGRVVRTLHDGLLDAGTQSIEWDGRDESGVSVSSGIYFARLNRPGSAPSLTKIALVE